MAVICSGLDCLSCRDVCGLYPQLAKQCLSPCIYSEIIQNLCIITLRTSLPSVITNEPFCECKRHNMVVFPQGNSTINSQFLIFVYSDRVYNQMNFISLGIRKTSPVEARSLLLISQIHPSAAIIIMQSCRWSLYIHIYKFHI